MAVICIDERCRSQTMLHVPPRRDGRLLSADETQYVLGGGGWGHAPLTCDSIPPRRTVCLRIIAISARRQYRSTRSGLSGTGGGRGWVTPGRVSSGEA